MPTIPGYVWFILGLYISGTLFRWRFQRAVRVLQDRYQRDMMAFKEEFSRRNSPPKVQHRHDVTDARLPQIHMADYNDYASDN